jgi:hypothetical protein
MLASNENAPAALARRTIFVSFRSAALELWGEPGLRDIAARVPRATREATIDAVTVADAMLPESYVLDWCLAAWEGPAGRSTQAYKGLLQRMMDHGFGRVRRALLTLASADQIIRKAAELWRHDHNTGDMRVVSCEGNRALVTLGDHVYLETPLARTSVVEIIRYAAALGRSRTVTAHGALDTPRLLRVTLTWS